MKFGTGSILGVLQRGSTHFITWLIASQRRYPVGRYGQRKLGIRGSEGLGDV